MCRAAAGEVAASLSSRTSEASVGIYSPCDGAGQAARTVDPDTRATGAALLRDDRRVLRALVQARPEHPKQCECECPCQCQWQLPEAWSVGVSAAPRPATLRRPQSPRAESREP